jgi:hypothetical protein
LRVRRHRRTTRGLRVGFHFRKGLCGRKRIVTEDALDDAFAEDSECALRDSLTHSGRNDCPDGFSSFWAFCSCRLCMLQQCGQQRALLRAENPLILHQGR